VAAILKMEIGRNFSMSGINSCHHNLPTYEISLKSNNVEFVRIVVANLKMATGINSELIPDSEKFLAVTIFRMAA
jgi:hypothetical protein